MTVDELAQLLHSDRILNATEFGTQAQALRDSDPDTFNKVLPLLGSAGQIYFLLGQIYWEFKTHPNHTLMDSLGGQGVMLKLRAALGDENL